MMRRGGGTGGLPSYGLAASTAYEHGSYGNGSYGSNGSYGNGSYGGNGYSYDGYGNTSYDGYASSNRGVSVSNDYQTMYKDKPRRRSNSDVVEMLKQKLAEPISWVAIVATLLLLSTIHFRGQRNWVLKELKASSVSSALSGFRNLKLDVDECQRDVLARKHTEKKLNSQISTLEASQKRNELEKKDLKLKLAESQKYGDAVNRLGARDLAWKTQVEVLQNATKRESRRAAAELFGPGPHHIEFTVILPTDEAERERHFTIELAPLDVMPHAVYFFLQQVYHGLWDNAWFYLNGPHVLQGGPQADEEEEDAYYAEHEDEEEWGRAVALKPFRDLALDTLAFPEYSHEFPHAKWTLGLTGRPGGPDFYINKMNNTLSHGPGGQYQHDLDEYGDPCFAKVVDGFDVMEQIFQEPTFPDDHDWGWFFEDPVHIVGARIMEDTPLHLDKMIGPDNAHDHSRKPKKPLKKTKLDHQVDP